VPVSRTHAASDLPIATRAQPPGWRDPRLWIGVAIVAVSVIAGARILGSADDSVTVWAAARDVAAGDTVGADDLVSTSVRFGDSADLERYLPTTMTLPDDLRLTRGLGAGELVPAAALGAGEESDTVIVSLSFPHELIPTNIGAGSTIELLVIPDDNAGGKEPTSTEPTTALTDVVVIDAPSATDALGSVSRGRQLVLGIPETDSDALIDILAASEDERVRVLVRG
jgi:hypothetical protein